MVLPFNNVSGDPDQDYFAAGVTVDLTTDLSRLPGMFVISPATAQTFNGKISMRGRSAAISTCGTCSKGACTRRGIRSASMLSWSMRGPAPISGPSALSSSVNVSRPGKTISWAGFHALNYRLTKIESERTFREGRDFLTPTTSRRGAGR